MNTYIDFLTHADQNVFFSFSSDITFDETEYEAMIIREEGALLPAVKTRAQETLQIRYPIHEKKPLSDFFQKTDPAEVPRLIQHLASGCLWIKEQEGLKLRNVSADPAWIFCDPETGKSDFLYIPSAEGIYVDEQAFESALRQGLLELIHNTFPDPDLTLTILEDELTDPGLDLDYFAHYLQEETSLPDENRALQESRILCLKPLDLRHTQWIEVSKSPFLIGRKESRVDGVIEESKLVSRVHCRIDLRSDSCTITDLASKNGTRVNAVRLEPELEYLVHAGDIIRIADVEFQLDWKYTGERNVERWNG